MKYLTILFVLISFVSGCGRSQLVRHSYVTNYTLGEIKTAYTGQSIVKVKDYYAYKDYMITYLLPSDDFEITADAPALLNNYKLNITGHKGKQYETSYKVTLAGVNYNIMYFLDSNGRNTYGILIDDRGMVKNNSLYTGAEIKPVNFSLKPPYLKFNNSTNADTFLCNVNINYSGNTCGMINHELIYSGINNVSMNITYREYTRSDFGKTSFYQNLTYEPNTKQIRFKDYQIEILEASNDKIVYKVMTDNLKNTEFYENENPLFTSLKSQR